MTSIHPLILLAPFALAALLVAIVVGTEVFFKTLDLIDWAKDGLRDKP
jgi:hypothetical protein